MHLIGLEDRVRCYAALALVALENRPQPTKDLLNEAKTMFGIALPLARHFGMMLRNSEIYTCIAMADESYNGDYRCNGYSLKPEFYSCLLAVLAEETGRQPVAGVRWIVERYKQDKHLKPRPYSIFTKAMKKFARNKKPK